MMRDKDYGITLIILLDNYSCFSQLKKMYNEKDFIYFCHPSFIRLLFFKSGNTIYYS